MREYKTLAEITKEWIASFNEHNIDKLLSLYHDNAVHYSPRLEAEKPETNGWLRGKEQLKEWWQRSFDELPSLSYELEDFSIGESKVFMEYTRRVDGERERYVMEFLKVENFLIVESRVLRSWIMDK